MSAAAAKSLVKLGASLFERRFTHGRTGNLSLRLGDELLITPSGVSLGNLRADELSRVALDGRHVGGPRPSKEAFLHAAMYRSRPDEAAVVRSVTKGQPPSAPLTRRPPTPSRSSRRPRACSCCSTAARPGR